MVYLIMQLIIVISIHAPERGATAGSIPPRAGAIISIHAPERGATPIQ